MKPVYIFYEVMDRPLAIQLEKGLREAKLPVRLDYPSVILGVNWVDQLLAGKVETGPIILCVSPRLIQSAWARQKISLAREHHLTLVPMMLEDSWALVDMYPETRWLRDEQAAMVAFDGQPFEAVQALVSRLQPFTADEIGMPGAMPKESDTH